MTIATSVVSFVHFSIWVFNFAKCDGN